MAPQLIDELRQSLGADGVRTADEDLTFYGSDRCRGSWPVRPTAVVLPRTVEEVRAVVDRCRHHGQALVPSGGRTGLAGAATATAGEVVLSLERMAKVLAVDAVGKTLRCQAGATVEAVQEAAAAAGLMYPVDFAAKGSAQIGGSIATNAGGVRVLRYGLTRDWVMGLDVVLASGELLRTGGSLVKNNTGYDLRQLFIGSEGTLGIVVEATLRLCTPPRGTVVGLCAVADDARVLALFSRIGRSDLVVSAFECFDAGCVGHVQAHRGRSGQSPFAQPAFQHVLVEVEVHEAGEEARERVAEALALCLADAQDAAEIADGVVAGSPQQGRELWSLREDISESLHRHTPHKSDISLPVSHVAAFLESWRELVARELPEYEALVFGHVGDGNLHLNILRPSHVALDEFLARCHSFDEVTYGLVRDHGGSISAEHGIGLLKREFLHYTRNDTEIAAMHAIKQALDPGGLLNPGKVLAPR